MEKKNLYDQSGYRILYTLVIQGLWSRVSGSKKKPGKKKKKKTYMTNKELV
jgi:hypothetical protein